jgi:hypothetical protein
MTDALVKIFIDYVLAEVNNVSDEYLFAVALQIEAQTKVNIQKNGQIDTGFMLNSTYALSRKSDTFANANPSGSYKNSNGETVKRAIVPPPPLPEKARAAVAVGAEYAIYQEEKKPFLFPAAETVARDQGGSAKTSFRKL